MADFDFDLQNSTKPEVDSDHSAPLARADALTATRAMDEEKATASADTSLPDMTVHDGLSESRRIEVTLEGTEHPFNWSNTRRWLITLQAALMIFSATITSSAPSGGSIVFQEELGTGDTVTFLIVSIFLVGYSVGPFITAPSTEAFGRRWPSIVFMFLYTIFNGACAACHSISSLLVCRFLAGCFASAPVTNSGSIVTDIWRPKERNLVMSIWSIGSFAGPALGPIVGGFISASSLPIYWIFIIMAIISGSMTLAISIFLPETYVPQMLHLKAKRLRHQTGNPAYTTRHSEGRGDIAKSLHIILTRPFSIFFREPILILSTIYSSFAYAVLYMLFPLYPIIFGEIHNLRPGIADLPFLATLGGVLIAINITVLYQRKYMKDLQRAGGKHTPELRLPPAYMGGPVMLIALLWLGWSGYKSTVSPVVPALSGFLTGIASVLIFRSFSSYVLECYKEYSASAMASVVVFRSLFGAGLPLAVGPMVRRLGIQWSATLLAGVQLVLIPVPFLFYRYGVKIRQRSPFARDE